MMNNTSQQYPQNECVSGITVNPMVGGMMSNIGDFIKKNAILVGVGAIGVGAAIYFLTKKKAKSGSGLSGVSTYRRKRKTSRASTRKTSRKPKRLTAKKLS